MAGPQAGFTQITLTGQYVDSDGNYMSGTVSFTPSQVMENNGVIVTPKTRTATLGSQGSFSIKLYANMDVAGSQGQTATVPANTFYQVTENLYYGGSQGAQADAQPRDYSIQIPIADASGALITTIDISQLMPGTPGGFDPPTPTIGGTLYRPAPFSGTVQWTTYLDLVETTQWLQFTGTPVAASAQANILQRIIDAACYRGQEIANRPLCPTTFFERSDGWSGEYIQLRFSPFLQLVKCTEWQSSGGPLNLTESTPENPTEGIQIDYDTSRVMRTFAGYSWPRPFFPGSRNIEFIYVAGENPVPPDVWMATVDLVAYWYRNSQQASRTFVGNSAVYGGQEGGSNDLWPGVPNRIAEVFEGYRMPSIG